MTRDPNIDLKLADLLDKMIDARRQGNDVATLMRHLPPEQQSELLAMLSLEAPLRDLSQVQPSEHAQQDALRRIERVTATPRPRNNYLQRHRALAWAASFLLFIVIAGSVTVSVATTSLPGDTMYPVKRASENMRMLLIRDAEGRVEYCVCLSEKRLQELEATARSGRVDRTVVTAMLASTQRAYRESERLPAHKREPMLAQIGHCCGYQADALKALQSWISDQDTTLILAAISECAARWDSCCGSGCCICPPGACPPMKR